MRFHCSLLAFLLGVTVAFGEDLRIGIIGCDTSHATAFTELLNNPQARDHVPGGKVVAAFKGGSPDVNSSATRVEGFARTLQDKYSVKMCETIEELCGQVDAVLLESVDGRAHRKQIEPVLKSRKPVFVDKPMAGSLADVIEIFRVAEEQKTPIFSSSALRFGKDTRKVHEGAIGLVDYAETSSPCELEPHHPDLFWYGVHGVESLFAVMGTGCESVRRGTTTDGKIEVTGTWKGNRRGVYRESKTYQGLAKGRGGESPVGSFDGYAPLVVEIMKFFKTGKSPVDPEETIEMFAFMEAADQSKRQGGAEVRLSQIRKNH